MCELVNLTALEKDERVGEIVLHFREGIQDTKTYRSLSAKKKRVTDAMLGKFADMRFRSKSDLNEAAGLFLSQIDERLGNEAGIVIETIFKTRISNHRGVLIIYTGGTIGSAPKDENDPGSPQVVKPWTQLKFAIPNLDRIGFPIDAISFDPPLDSCNVGPAHWKAMASIIQKYYEDYEGFVILHGTDTMVYTSSALAFMLKNLAKPVVLTGSLIAGIVNVRNDAHQNTLTSLHLANPKASGLKAIPEVIVVFGSKIVRGCRAKKMDAAGYDGFDSPNMPLLGTAGDLIEIDSKRVRPLPLGKTLEVHSLMNTNVLTIDVFPGIQASSVSERLLQDPNIKGVLLKSYGTGNVPTHRTFLDPIRRITDRVVVVNVTQCPKGTVELGLYETSQILLDHGIVGGFDITPEAALCKLMFLLGKYGDDVAKVKRFMQRSLAGEQSYSVFTTPFIQHGSLGPGNRRFDFQAVPMTGVAGGLIDHALLRFHRVQLGVGKSSRVHFQLYLHLDAGDCGGARTVCLGSFFKAKPVPFTLLDTDRHFESLAFDLSRARDLLTESLHEEENGRNRVSFSVTMEDPDTNFGWETMDLVIFIYEK